MLTHWLKVFRELGGPLGGSLKSRQELSTDDWISEAAPKLPDNSPQPPMRLPVLE